MCISQNRGGHHGRLTIPTACKRQLFAGTQKPGSVIVNNKGVRKKRRSQTVRHNYHDHFRDENPSSSDEEDSPKDFDRAHFPIKLHAILDNIEQDGHGHVISWQPHGRSFKVHKQEIFMKTILPQYFKLSKYASFQRQLNLYEFQRITRGPDKGGYYHELFLRGKPFLSHRIGRRRVKGTGVRPRSNPDTEPDFYAMPAIDTDSPAPTNPPMYKEETDVKMEDVESERGRTPSPSPSVWDSRTPKEKLSSAFPTETVSSSVVPNYETASSCVSEIRRLEDDDEDDDEVVIFEGKPFHYIDPLKALRAAQQPTEARPTLVPSYHHEYDDQKDARKQEDTKCEQQEGSLFTITQMDAMMERLNVPGGIWSITSNVNNMDDQTFGTVLENIVVHGDKYGI